MGAVGVTGTGAANALAAQADVILGVGTRFADFTTGSWALVPEPGSPLHLDQRAALRRGQASRLSVVGDARTALAALDAKLGAWKAPRAWSDEAAKAKAEWEATAARYIAPTNAAAPSDAEVLGALMRAGEKSDVVVCAAGGLPGELHKLWRAGAPLGYHVEYGYSCMGYEIAGGIGVKMALPDREVVVVLGDGSYLMMNSEIATAVMLGAEAHHRRQRQPRLWLHQPPAAGDRRRAVQQPVCATRGTRRCRRSISSPMPRDWRGCGEGRLDRGTGDRLQRRAQQSRRQVIVIDTDPMGSTDAGGAWWDVAVPEVSERRQVDAARRTYEDAKTLQRVGDCHDHSHRRQPDRLDQRRLAGDRRRHAAGDLPRRGERGRRRRHGEGPQDADAMARRSRPSSPSSA